MSKKERQRVLVVDDELSIRTVLEVTLHDAGYDVVTAESFAEGKDELARGPFDLAIVDKNLGDGYGIDLIRHIADTENDCATIVMTAHSSIESAVESLKLGVSDYLAKPFASIDMVNHAVKRVLKTQSLERQNRTLVRELKLQNETLRRLTVRDPLTKLFNHGYLQNALRAEVARAEREKSALSLLFMDLDRFKQVNSELGHVVGDQLICELADILTEQHWKKDVPVFGKRQYDICARYGGNHFALLAPATPRAGAMTLAERLRTFVAHHQFELAGNQTISIGIATYPDDASEPVGLIEAADLALYSAKHLGRNRSLSYAPALLNVRVSEEGNRALAVAQIESLDRCIAQHEFDYVYQPIIVAATGATFAYEALVRPRAKEFPTPGALIETAERAGRIGPLGRALRQSSTLALDRLPADACLFVNLHPQELFDPEFIAIEPFMAQWADQICFEITEVAALKDHGRIRDIMSKLRGAGFRIALDDLGAGYSGLNSLSVLQPDFVKLDMQLVREVNKNSRTKRLVRHVIEFSTEERMKVVAEGIETEQERDTLIELGCHYLQGYLFSKPKPIDSFL